MLEESVFNTHRQANKHYLHTSHSGGKYVQHKLSVSIWISNLLVKQPGSYLHASDKIPIFLSSIDVSNWWPAAIKRTRLLIPECSVGSPSKALPYLEKKNNKCQAGNCVIQPITVAGDVIITVQ